MKPVDVRYGGSLADIGQGSSEVCPDAKADILQPRFRGSVKKWIERYCDPCDPKVDAVDWVEQIPFSETRNYVQRIMENPKKNPRQLPAGGSPSVSRLSGSEVTLSAKL